jgi:hypothetical protein
MMPVLVFISISMILAALATAPLWLDRAAVWVMRSFHFFLFPNAIRLASVLSAIPANGRSTPMG